MNYYQQGDVLMKPVEQVPRDADKQPEAILAEGEVTGHHHRAVGEGVTLCRHRSELYLSAPYGAEIVHPEHKPIRVSPGHYRIERVQEYDHFGELAQARPGRTLSSRFDRAGLQRQAMPSRVVRPVID